MMNHHDDTLGRPSNWRAILSHIARSASILRPVTDAVSFFAEFLRAPTMIGSVIPTSQSVVDAMLAPVDWRHVRLFVEYGPGMGTFTRDILSRLSPDATLIAIDTNPRFVHHLREDIRDRRLRVVEGSALDVGAIIADAGMECADFVLSGIPFSTLPEGVGPAIAAATHDALRPGGAFLVYQYSRYVYPLLQPHFARIDEEKRWLNVPPCCTFVAWKDEPAVLDAPPITACSHES